MRLSVEYLNDCKKRDLSCVEVAKEAGCGITAVYRFCKRNGIKLRKKPCGGANVKEITGKQFGALTVIRRAEVKNDRQLAMWECQCKCGNTCIAYGVDLVHNRTKTCGCRTGIESKRNWQGYGEIPKSYWRTLNRNASLKNRELTVTIDYINDLLLSQNRRCALSGLEISFKDTTASLDRIDNDKGYVPGNVQWVHKHINNMKHTYENTYFVDLCCLIAEHHRRGKVQDQTLVGEEHATIQTPAVGRVPRRGRPQE
jgi:hypothetical protein